LVQALQFDQAKELLELYFASGLCEELFRELVVLQGSFELPEVAVAIRETHVHRGFVSGF
jgi:hypothetical protein